LDKNENLKTLFSFFPSVQVSDVTKPVFVSRNKLECLSIEVKCNPSLNFEGQAVSFTGKFDLQPQTSNLTEKKYIFYFLLFDKHVSLLWKRVRNSVKKFYNISAR
jgi:hypothetical protein